MVEKRKLLYGILAVVVLIIIVMIGSVVLFLFFIPIGPGDIPNDSDIKNAIITLERGPCYGVCPVYKLTIYGDGNVVFEGKRFVNTIGKINSTTGKDIKYLMIMFFEMGYFSMKDSYDERGDECTEMATDMPTVITSMTVEGKTKKITHYLGNMCAPKRLTQLEELIDKTANSEQWVYGTNPEDVRAVSKKCGVDSDCTLINKDLNYSACWPGACAEIDYSLDKYIAVNESSFHVFKNNVAKSRRQPSNCGPAPACPTKLVNGNFEAKCVGSSGRDAFDGTCTKVTK